MKALKILVLSMGVVLVVGFGFLIWGLTGRGGSAPTASPQPHAAVHAAGQEFGQVTVPLPAGSKVDQIIAVDNRLVARIIAAGGDQHLMVLDVATGHVMGEFALAVAHP